MAEPREPEMSSGLDYLEKAGKLAPIDKRGPAHPEGSEPTSTSSDLTSSLEAFAARTLLETIRRIETEKGGDHPGALLSECAKQIGMSGEVLIPLSRRLEDAGLVKTLKSDDFGNNLVTRTDAADQLLGSSDPIRALTSLLG